MILNMVDRVCELPSCGASFRAKPAAVAKGAGRFCSRACAYAARRVEAVEHVCAHCGKPSGLRAAAIKRGRKYCGRDCYDAAHLVHDRPAELPCEQCGTLYPTSGRAAGTRFCSRGCSSAALKRAGAPPPCAQCGKERQWKYGTSVNTVGPYCSRGCAGQARRKRREVVCLACGTIFEKRHSELSAYRSIHCSRACRKLTAERRAISTTCKRDGCDVPLRVLPSQIANGEGKYCSLRCRGIARRLRYPRVTVRCRGCRKRVTAPPWRKRVFCGNGCANGGRPRARDPRIVARDARILELYAQGLTSPMIAARLAENPDWRATPAGVRQVVRRAG
jgi:hypothetical protein